MLQIRLVEPDFSNGINFTNPVIMERADNVSLYKTVNSSDEGIAFDLAVNDSKMENVTYLKWWECWDTETGKRLNYGPITEISRESGGVKRITGTGRSSVFKDYHKTVQTFYYPINQFIDDLRYENFAGQPRTSTIINKATNSDYYGLSKRSKDFAIDEQTGYIAVGRDTPVKGNVRTDQFWSGIGRADSLTVNIGDDYYISKARILLPWWGNVTYNNNRVYDWSLSYSDDNVTYTPIYQTPIPNLKGTGPGFGGKTIFFGEDGFEVNKFIASGLPIDAQYWKINITNTHAWYGNDFESTTDKSDEWAWECAGSDIFDGETRPSPTDGTIPDDTLTITNDCHASVVEVGLYRKIINQDTISNLSYKQIENSSRQITYYHVPDEDEMITIDGGKKFEPGTFFRKISYTSGSSVTVKDEFNVVLREGGSAFLRCPANTRLLRFTGTSDVQVTYADTWPGVLDAFSYGGSYSFTEIEDDYAIIHFKGVSFKWYATIPSGKTPADVKIEIREKDDDGVWSAWTTLEDSLTLPVGVAAEKVWEISYESGILEDGPVYDIRLTNLNGGFMSIDSFAGYWSGSFVDYNEDHARVYERYPHETVQYYDPKFSAGSVNAFAKPRGTVEFPASTTSIGFSGDRVIVYSRKGPGYGRVKIGLFKHNDNPELPSEQVNIPGGESDGGLLVDLDSDHEINQAIIFDSLEYFTEPEDGLPWASYSCGVYRVGDAGPIWLDGFGVHEQEGISVKFINTSHLDVLSSVAEALVMEWDITEQGLKVVPRIGEDTDSLFVEGRGTTIRFQTVEDVTKVASMLVSTGADIDGLPLSAVVEDKKTRRLFGRTIQRLYDLRNVGDYFTLIGAARAELLRRREPEKRPVLTTTKFDLNPGDSFMIKTPDIEARVRATTVTRIQSSQDGTSYEVQCELWPRII